MPIIRVALDVPLSTLFDYFFSVDLPINIGQRVLVQFGRKHVVGIVMELAESSDLAAERIKPVVQALDDVPPLPAELLTLMRFCSDYYHHPLGMTVMAALPARLRAQEPVTIKQELSFTLTDSGRALDLNQFPKRRVIQHRVLQALQNGALSGMQIRAMSSSAPANLKLMIEQGWVKG
jgi:primosomal protein N' (replication factor Y)